MRLLLNKFRIPVSEVVVIPDVASPAPALQTQTWFDDLTRKFFIADDDLKSNEQLTGMPLLRWRKGSRNKKSKWERFFWRYSSVDQSIRNKGAESQYVELPATKGIITTLFFECQPCSYVSHIWCFSNTNILTAHFQTTLQIFGKGTISIGRCTWVG